MRVIILLLLQLVFFCSFSQNKASIDIIAGGEYSDRVLNPSSARPVSASGKSNFRIGMNYNFSD